MTKRRSGEAQAAQRRNAGPMKHRNAPRGGARNQQADLLEELLDETEDLIEQAYEAGYQAAYQELRASLETLTRKK